MDDLISRAAAIEHMKVMADCAKCDNYNYVRCRACSWDDAMNIVEELPAVDAAPVVHGRWEPTTHGFPPEPTTVCSNCGLDIDYEICKRIKADSFSYTSIRPSYCPHCGAKMMEVEHGNRNHP